MYKINDLLDLSHTIAARLFDGLEYPWEALPAIKGFILALGPTLPEDEFDRRGFLTFWREWRRRRGGSALRQECAQEKSNG